MIGERVCLITVHLAGRARSMNVPAQSILNKTSTSAAYVSPMAQIGIVEIIVLFVLLILLVGVVVYAAVRLANRR